MYRKIDKQLKCTYIAVYVYFKKYTYFKKSCVCVVFLLFPALWTPL